MYCSWNKFHVYESNFAELKLFCLRNIYTYKLLKNNSLDVLHVYALLKLNCQLYFGKKFVFIIERLSTHRNTFKTHQQINVEEYCIRSLNTLQCCMNCIRSRPHWVWGKLVPLHKFTLYKVSVKITPKNTRYWDVVIKFDLFHIHLITDVSKRHKNFITPLWLACYVYRIEVNRKQKTTNWHIYLSFGDICVCV